MLLADTSLSCLKKKGTLLVLVMLDGVLIFAQRIATTGLMHLIFQHLLSVHVLQLLVIIVVAKA